MKNFIRCITAFILAIILLMSTAAFAAVDVCRDQLMGDMRKLVRAYKYNNDSRAEIANDYSNVTLSNSYKLAHMVWSVNNDPTKIKKATYANMFELMDDERILILYIDDNPAMTMNARYGAEWSVGNYNRNPDYITLIAEGIDLLDAVYSDVLVAGGYVFDTRREVAAYQGELYRAQDILDYILADLVARQDAFERNSKTVSYNAPLAEFTAQPVTWEQIADEAKGRSRAANTAIIIVAVIVIAGAIAFIAVKKRRATDSE